MMSDENMGVVVPGLIVRPDGMRAAAVPSLAVCKSCAASGDKALKRTGRRRKKKS